MLDHRGHFTVVGFLPNAIRPIPYSAKHLEMSAVVIWYYINKPESIEFAPRCFINTSTRQRYLRRSLTRQETLFQEQSLSAKMNCEQLKIEGLF